MNKIKTKTISKIFFVLLLGMSSLASADVKWTGYYAGLPEHELEWVGYFSDPAPAACILKAKNHGKRYTTTLNPKTFMNGMLLDQVRMPNFRDRFGFEIRLSSVADSNFGPNGLIDAVLMSSDVVFDDSLLGGLTVQFRGKATVGSCAVQDFKIKADVDPETCLLSNIKIQDKGAGDSCWHL